MACGISPHDTDRLWYMDFIPYRASENVRTKVGEAIQHIESVTPIRFSRLPLSNNDPDRDFLFLSSGSGVNSTNLGREPGQNDISLSEDASWGVVVHEICHRLGFWHENAHPDRDRFLKINWHNIRQGKCRQFQKRPSLGVIALGGYDHKSIMHYEAKQFGKPAPNNITIVNLKGDPIGQRAGLSLGDIAGLKILYPNLDWP